MQGYWMNLLQGPEDLAGLREAGGGEQRLQGLTNFESHLYCFPAV